MSALPLRRGDTPPQPAQVAELVDALASGASGRKVVEVRVFSWAPSPLRNREDRLARAGLAACWRWPTPAADVPQTGFVSAAAAPHEIGRAAGRERVSQYV